MVETGEQAFEPWTNDAIEEQRAQSDAHHVSMRLQRMMSIVERTRAKIEALCVLGDLVGEKAAMAADAAPSGEEALADVERTLARLALQFQDSAEETERLLLDFAGEQGRDDAA